MHEFFKICCYLCFKSVHCLLKTKWLMKRHLVKGGNSKKDVYFWSIPKNGCPFLFCQGFSQCEKLKKNIQRKRSCTKSMNSPSEANLPHCAYCSGLGINAIGHTLSWWFGCNFDHKKYTLRVLRAIKKCHLCGRQVPLQTSQLKLSWLLNCVSGVRINK